MKSLVVIALLVLGCSFASAQTFGFLSIGGFAYCNFEQLTPFFGPIYSGVDNLTAACGLPVNGTIVGSATSIAASSGLPATGKGVGYADNIYDAEFEEYTGLQWWVFTQLKPSKLLFHYGWIGFAGGSGSIFGDNYGYLSASIPGRNGVKATAGLSTGNAKGQFSKK